MLNIGRGYKILIADDEPIIRERLKLNIEKAGFETVGSAETGLQAYEMYESTKPDIIVSDIFMPAMNGAELLEKIRKTDRQVKFIFLTGYSEFEYAMSALKNNASDYLMKPLDSLKLIEVLQKLVDEIKEEEKLKYLKRENLMIKEGQYIDYFFSTGEINPEMNRTLAQGLLNPEGTKMIMIYGPFDWERIEEDIYPIENDIYIIFFKRSGNNIIKNCTSSCYAGMGGACHSEKELRASFLYLRRILLHRFFSPDKHHYLNGVVTKVDKEKLQEINVRNRKLLKNNEIGEFIELIDADLAVLRTPANLEYYVYLMKGLVFRKMDKISGIMLSDHSPIWILEQFITLSEFGVWLKELVQKTMSENIEECDLELSTRVKQYLQENYTTAINLKTIAVNVFAHPNYISTKFKEDLGVSVTEYLCSLRLEKAKNLLNTTNLSCKRVSQLVGFQDQFYFGKCFKKKYAISPTALQKNLPNK